MLLAPLGTAKVRVVAFTTAKFVTANVPMRTKVVPVRFVPASVASSRSRKVRWLLQK